MDTSYHFYVTDDATPSDRDTIERGLEAFNTRFIGEDNYKPLYIVMRNKQSEIMGGLLGATYWKWLYVRIMWIDEAARGKGNGKRMMAMAEQEAYARGCCNAHVDTFDFQALGFYNKLGYSVWGRLEDFTPGYTRYFLKKALTNSNG
ncbi:MAG: GNAT family N-acetyltransferase [Chloroflexota bacterium]|nr:GNAT family N-acetyltransferase [Chloroflexota bacterium]